MTLRQDRNKQLHDAVLDNNFKKVNRLLSRHKNEIDIDQQYGYPSGSDTIHLTALQIACWQGNKDIVSLLLKNGANINSQTSNGETPLHLAVRYGFAEVVDMLLQQGADINIIENRFF